MDFATDILIKIIAALLLCGIFFRLVMRGRWVAWGHPVCAGCGHNLTGLPESSTNCPECGGELAKVRKNSIWRRRWVSLGCAGVLTLICLAILVPVAIQFVDRVPTVALMPFRGNARVRQILIDRLGEGKLTGSQQQKVIDQMLAAPSWMDAQLIENLHDMRQLPDAGWRKYAAWAMEFPTFVRGKVGYGDPLVVQVQAPYARVRSTQSSLRMKGRVHVTIDQTEIPLSENERDLSPDGKTRVNNLVIPMAADLRAKFSDGIHQIRVDVDGQVFDKDAPGRVLASGRRTYTTAVDLLPRGKAAVELVKPESEQMQPRQPKGLSMTVFRNGEDPDSDGNANSWMPKSYERSYCYKMIARQNGREIVIGTFATARGEYYWWPDRAGDLQPGVCDVTMRPNVEKAKLAISITEIIDWEFTVHDVKVMEKHEDRH